MGINNNQLLENLTWFLANATDCEDAKQIMKSVDK